MGVSIPNDNICFQACPSDTLTIRTVLLLALDKSLLGDRGCVLLWYGLQHMVFLWCSWFVIVDGLFSWALHVEHVGITFLQITEALLKERDKQAKWNGIPLLLQKLYEHSHPNSDFSQCQSILKVVPSSAFFWNPRAVLWLLSLKANFKYAYQLWFLELFLWLYLWIECR